MQVPLDIHFRDTRETPAIRSLIEKEVTKLEEICNYIVSCRIAVEKSQMRQQTGNPYRIRINVRVPPKHELVADHDSLKGNINEELTHVIRETFDAIRDQLQRLVEKERNEIKTHSAQEINGIIDKLFREEGYGFIRDIKDGDEVYFHRNSVINIKFDNLKIGDGVHYVKEIGDNGQQATTVHLIDNPKAPISAARRK